MDAKEKNQILQRRTRNNVLTTPVKPFTMTTTTWSVWELDEGV